MFGIFSRGRKSPLEYHYPDVSGISSVLEAKLAAWAIVIGVDMPAAYPPHSRGHHYGMSEDLPAPEPAPRRPRPSLRSMVAAMRRVMSFGGQQPAGAAALSGILPGPVGETAAMTYIGGSDARESERAPSNAGHEAMQSRVA